MEIKLGAHIAALRRAGGLTQEQLAQAVGVSAPAVSKWETDASCPDIALLCPLARALGVDVDTLLQFEDTLPDEALIERYVRPALAGTMIGALAITEPDGGSDVAGIRTCAVRDGDHYVVNGAKTYITSGVRADFVTTAVCTDFPGSGSLSLLVIDKGTPGFTVGRRLEKLGWHCSDTAELSFADVRVPVSNRVGPEDTGFLAIMQQFANERISLATQAYATAQRCVDLAVRWSRDRQAFGRPLVARQVVRHRLAEMHSRTEAARAYVHEVAERVAAGQPVVTEVAIAKNVAVSACDFVVDAALQLHGGFGYMRDAEVERHYRDARLLGIGGGATEIMNEIIAKGMGL